MKGGFFQAIAIAAIAAAAAAACSCTVQKRIAGIRNGSTGITIALPDYSTPETGKYETGNTEDAIYSDDPLTGEEILIMNAVKDEETGEMIATGTLRPITVTAKFKTLAERGGKVDIGFDINVPEAMISDKWQVRLFPVFIIRGDSVPLENIYITGKNYRKEQLRGYELYERFISRIIPDSVDYHEYFTYRKLLEKFISRNIPALDRLRLDSCIVSAADTAGLFGITLEEAKEHYKRTLRIRRNERLKGRKSEMFERFVPSPVKPDGVRIDTTAEGGDFHYRYIEETEVTPGLRKIDLVIGGCIFSEGKEICRIPDSEPVTFYISSVSTMTDRTVRYVKKIVERNVQANTAAYIDFNQGSSSIDTSLHENRYEIDRIKRNIVEILENEYFITDSLKITASCSPEGLYVSNNRLARERALSIKRYFEKYITDRTDSIRTATVIGETAVPAEDFSYTILTAHIPEEWDRLKILIENDTLVSEREKILSVFAITDPDEREKAISRCTDYPYIRKHLYPMLRCVKFDFFLHRKGMVKDTIHTTEIDSLYMSGIQAIENMDYKKAVTILRPYGDYNAAIACICMDYNNSALEILEKLPENPQRNYMLALVLSRLGKENNAVKYYLKAVESDHSFRHRGNLDPEISRLIKRYSLFKEEE